LRCDCGGSSRGGIRVADDRPAVSRWAGCGHVFGVGPGRVASAYVACNGTRCAALAFTADMDQEPLGACTEPSSADATCGDCTSNATGDPADAGVAIVVIGDCFGSAPRPGVHPGTLKLMLQDSAVNRASGLKGGVGTASSAAGGWRDARSQIATLDSTARPSRHCLSLGIYQLDRRHLMPRHAQCDAG
jgi:hypothetical protein